MGWCKEWARTHGSSFFALDKHGQHHGSNLGRQGLSNIPVIGVKDDGDSVDGGNGADVMGSSNGAGDGSLLVLVANGFKVSADVVCMEPPWVRSWRGSAQDAAPGDRGVDIPFPAK